jgi:hypothetical protein
MPRQKSLITVIRELVQKEVSNAIQRLLGSVGGRKPGRRRRRRGPGRPPGSKTRRRRGRPPKSAAV